MQYSTETLLTDLFHCGIIDDVNAVNKKLEEMNYKKKEKQILEKTTLPQVPNYKNLFRKSFKKNGIQTQIYASTYNELIQKVYTFLFEENKSDYTFKEIFDLAFDNFVKTSDRDSKTFSAYQAYYKRFISDDFGNKMIKDISKNDLKQYSKELVQNKNINNKAFLKYKSVLNLVYEYAFDKDIVPANIASVVKPKDYYRSLNSSYVRPEDKIFTENELMLIQNEIRKRMLQKKYGSFYTNGYAILLSMQTAMRAGEICALKWKDVCFEKSQIWIHEQQLKEITPKGQKSKYYDVPWTKDEKGHSKGGRYFPIDNDLYNLLNEIKDKQSSLNIKSQFVLCDEFGEPLKTDAYETALRRLCKSLHLNITNNHAFRMTYNSLVLIPAGFTVTERAAILGHSVQTNETHYSFDPRNSLSDKVTKLNKFKSNSNEALTPCNTQNVISFQQKKSLKAL